MIKFKVLCDPEAKPNGSSRIITDATNNAAQKLGLYSEDGVKVFYDCLCQSHGLEADAFWAAYELPFPKYLLDSAKGKPILGLSRDNAMMAIYGGYDPKLTNHVNLGVDSESWKYCYREKHKGNGFVFLCCCESNTRSGFEDLIPAFGREFSKDTNVTLYIKDRNATDSFKNWVKEQADFYRVNIIHDDRDLHTIQEQMDLYAMADVFICMNHSHTWGMTRTQALSCGVPIITMSYQGGAEYLRPFLSGLEVEYSIESVDNHVLNSLVHIGMKNHLFPVNEGVYIHPPFWAKAKEDSLRATMREIYCNPSVLIGYSKISRRIAEWNSWERCAMNMSAVLGEWF